MEVDGQVTLVFPAKARFDMTIQAMGMKMSRVFDGESAWLVTPQGVQPFPESFVDEARKECFRENTHLLTYLAGADISVQYLGAEDVNGTTAEVILVRNTPADSLKLFIDQETKYIVKKEFQALGQQGPVDREEFSNDYREISGVKVPFHVVLMDNGEKSAEITLDEVMINAEVDESLFEK